LKWPAQALGVAQRDFVRFGLAHMLTSVPQSSRGGSLMAFVLFLAVVLVLVYRVMTAEDRVRFVRAVSRGARRATQVITLQHQELEPFNQMLRARTPVAPVTPTLIAVSIAIFALMAWGPHPLGDHNTLVGWGANFAPRTTNGEWWRVVSTLFLHTSWLHLLVNVIGLLQLGLVLERLVGPIAFAAVYLASGMLFGVLSLSDSHGVVSLGASSAIVGVQGLTLALLTWGVLRRSAPVVPLVVLKHLAPAAVVFLAYSLATDAVDGAAGFAAVVTGFLCGLAIAGNIDRGRASMPRIAAATAVTLVIAAAATTPLSGIVDATPEFERLATIEARMATTFRAAADEFSKGRITAEALAEVIERSIIPEMQAARARIETLDNVLPEQQARLNASKEYLRLRNESWRVRSEAFRQSSMSMLREADTIERASLDILRRIAPTGQG
jgi:membrane associated rhomboid family serine protease